MGSEAFWVPAAISLASGGAQYVNQQQAAKRADTANAKNIMDQGALEQKAVGQTSALTRAIAASNPQNIQGKSTADYVSQLRRNAASGPSSLAPAVGANPRYAKDVQKSNATVQDFGNQTAGQMGAIDAAVRQRQNEGLDMQTVQTGLNGLNAQSGSTNFVNNLRMQQAGQPNPWVTLGAGILQNGAKAYATNYDPNAGLDGIDTSWANRFRIPA